MNTSADQYFLEGCGRCSKGGTPDCKVHLYAQELAALRTLILETGLEEDCKWGSPCYTLGGKNVVMLQVFAKDPEFQKAFEGLTPGRQRGYILHFTGAKQEKTKLARIEKNKQRILNGYGMNDCVCGRSKRMPNCDGSHKYIG